MRLKRFSVQSGALDSIVGVALNVTSVTPVVSSANNEQTAHTDVAGTYERDDMSPTGSRFDARSVLASLVTISVLFIGSASIAGCQNGTVTQSSDPQSQVSSSSAAPSPGPTLLTTAPAVVAAPIPAASPAALPPPPPQVSAPRIAAVAPPAAGSAQQSASCDADYYRNSNGNCVHRPQQAAAAPAGATARCSDGEYSFSQHRQGTCSGHGGVAQWL
ncbi:MAG TPA: DUF3761 domain-containing protein [Pseudonocardiaceae bacterium]|nr:DUF3761 domain-containing protein [Pseudonocardiaceae bacterium]